MSTVHIYASNNEFFYFRAFVNKLLHLANGDFPHHILAAMNRRHHHIWLGSQIPRINIEYNFHETHLKSKQNPLVEQSKNTQMMQHFIPLFQLDKYKSYLLNHISARTLYPPQNNP